MEKLLKKIDELKRDIERCRREIALVSGETSPCENDFHDQLILKIYWQFPDKNAFINDLKLKLKIMEKTLEIYENERGRNGSRALANVICISDYRRKKLDGAKSRTRRKKYAISRNQ